MKIVRVLVNDMVEKCLECDFILYVGREYRDPLYVCKAHKPKEHIYGVIDDIESRPDWCPLVPFVGEDMDFVLGRYK